AQYGLTATLLTITVTGAENKPVGTILIGQRPSADNKKEYAAMAEGGPTVFLIRDYLVTRLNKQPQDFVEHATPTPSGTAAPQVGSGAPAPAPEVNVMDEEGEDEGDDQPQ